MLQDQMMLIRCLMWAVVKRWAASPIAQHAIQRTDPYHCLHLSIHMYAWSTANQETASNSLLRMRTRKIILLINAKEERYQTIRANLMTLKIVILYRYLVAENLLYLNFCRNSTKMKQTVSVITFLKKMSIIKPIKVTQVKERESLRRFLVALSKKC